MLESTTILVVVKWTCWFVLAGAVEVDAYGFVAACSFIVLTDHV